MRFVTVTELRANATQIISEIVETKREIIITKRGKPVTIIHPVSDKGFSFKDRCKGREVL